MTDQPQDDQWGRQDNAGEWAQNSEGWDDNVQQSWGQSNWETPEENIQLTQQSYTQNTSTVPPVSTQQFQQSESSHSAPQALIPAQSLPSLPSLSLMNTQIPQINTIQTTVKLEDSKFHYTVPTNAPKPAQSIQNRDQSLDFQQDAVSDPLQTTTAQTGGVDFWNDPLDLVPSVVIQQPVEPVPIAQKSVPDDFFDFTPSKPPQTVQQTPKQVETPVPPASSKAEPKSEPNPPQQQQQMPPRAQQKKPDHAPAQVVPSSNALQKKQTSRAELKKQEKLERENAKKREQMSKTLQSKHPAANHSTSEVTVRQPQLQNAAPAQERVPAQAQAQGTSPAPKLQTPPTASGLDFERFEAIIRENESLKAEISSFSLDGTQNFKNECVRRLFERLSELNPEDNEAQRLQETNAVLLSRIRDLEAVNYEASQSSVLYYQQQTMQLQRELIEKEEEKMRAAEQGNVALRKKNQQIQGLMEEVARLRVDLGRK